MATHYTPSFVLLCQSEALVSGRHDGRLLLRVVVRERTSSVLLAATLGSPSAGIPRRLLGSHLEGNSVATARRCCSSRRRRRRAAVSAATRPDKRFKLLSHAKQLSQVVPQTGQFRKLSRESMCPLKKLLDKVKGGLNLSPTRGPTPGFA